MMISATRDWVIDLMNKVFKKAMPFKLGIDENGNYGYIKVGADSVTPFC